VIFSTSIVLILIFLIKGLLDFITPNVKASLEGGLVGDLFPVNYLNLDFLDWRIY